MRYLAKSNCNCMTQNMLPIPIKQRQYQSPWSTTTISSTSIGRLKYLRRRQRQKTVGFMSKTTALKVHHAFQYISLTSTVWLLRETFQCDVLWRTWTYDDRFFFLYLNMDKALKNSTPGKVAYIWRIERFQIDAIKFERTQIHFISNVLTAAVVVA